MSKLNPTFYATIKNGKLQHRNEDRFNLWLGQFKEGDQLEITVKKVRKVRTQSQHNFYWLYMTLIEEETGEDKNILHEYFKRLFLPPRIVTVMGKNVKLPASTTTLNKLEFGEYMDKIFALTNIPIPNPEEVN